MMKVCQFVAVSMERYITTIIKFAWFEIAHIYGKIAGANDNKLYRMHLKLLRKDQMDPSYTHSHTIYSLRVR